MKSIKDKLKKIDGFVLLYESYARFRQKDATCEQQRVFGLANPSKTFYVIRTERPITGLMGLHNCVLTHISYAVEKGYIPVVDLKNHLTMYHEEGDLGKVNIWETYFEQPTPYTLEDAYKSSRVILSCHGKQDMPNGHNVMDSKQDIMRCNQLMNQYMKYNKETRNLLEEEEALLRKRANGKKILGVCCRGSDFLTLQPSQHSVPYTAEQTIALVKEKLQEWNEYELIYLATEDESVLETFQREFEESGNLYYLDCQRFPSNTNNRLLAEISFEREHDKYLKGLEYLKTIYLLSKCDSAIAPQVGGTVAAFRMNGNEYEHAIIIENGKYQ
ncbi:MAG: hypothetical protein R3Y67_09925 [Eubacteriales bacterium]